MNLNNFNDVMHLYNRNKMSSKTFVDIVIKYNLIDKFKKYIKCFHQLNDSIAYLIDFRMIELGRSAEINISPNHINSMFKQAWRQHNNVVVQYILTNYANDIDDIDAYLEESDDSYDNIIWSKRGKMCYITLLHHIGTNDAVKYICERFTDFMYYIEPFFVYINYQHTFEDTFELMLAEIQKQYVGSLFNEINIPFRQNRVDDENAYGPEYIGKILYHNGKLRKKIYARCSKSINVFKKYIKYGKENNYTIPPSNDIDEYIHDIIRYFNIPLLYLLMNCYSTSDLFIPWAYTSSSLVYMYEKKYIEFDTSKNNNNTVKNRDIRDIETNINMSKYVCNDIATLIGKYVPYEIVDEN
jgi:hypothetical protein